MQFICYYLNGYENTNYGGHIMDANGMNTENQQFQQPVQPQQNLYQGAMLEEPMSVGSWLITFLILLIPCANIVMVFVWAFSGSEKKSKSNYFKAVLIWAAIWTGISIILSIVMGAAMVSIIRNLQYMLY